MGDRGNIVIEFAPKQERIYLYTHWGGSQIGADLQRALAKRWRWTDTAYLTRIIYDTLVGIQVGTETGFGIAVAAPDNEHPYIVVRPDVQTVTYESEDGNVLAGPYSFDAFLTLDEPDDF